MNDLKGKIALITGATSGIGEACAIRFAQAGAIVLVAGRSEERGRKVEAKIDEMGGKAEFIKMDIASDESLAADAEYIKQKYDHIDILVNNAGIFPVQPQIEQLERKDIDEVFNTNVDSVLMTIRYMSPLISEGGVILNNASVSGLFDNTLGLGSYVYAASKSAVIKITKVLAKRMAPAIRVNAISPGFINTPLYNTFNEEAIASRVPLRKAGKPEDVAALANFLVSDDAAYITGDIVTIDGGLSL